MNELQIGNPPEFDGVEDLHVPVEECNPTPPNDLYFYDGYKLDCHADTDRNITASIWDALFAKRRYAYSLAPHYLSVRIWALNAEGQRLRSDLFTPTAGSTIQQRYDACSAMIWNVGLVPPPYQT